MTGFLPVGYLPLKDAAATIGAERLGSALAGGARKAFILDPWGTLREMGVEFWRGRDGVAVMETGIIPKKTSGGTRYQYGGCQILVKALPQPDNRAKAANAMLAQIVDDRKKAMNAPPVVKKNTGGRPPKYDWAAAGGYIAGFIVENDYPSQTKAVEILAKWFSDRGNEPDTRDVERFIASMYEHRKTRET